MNVKTVFLSSTAKDLTAYRKAAGDAINALEGYKCIRMEEFGARDAMADDFCREKVAECDVFVGILGHCYGGSPKGSEESYTEQEYDSAIIAGVPRLMFLAPEDFPLPTNLREPDERWSKQRAFRDRVSTERIRDTFSSPEDLTRRVVQAIHNWAQQQAAADQRPALGRDVFVSYSHKDSDWVRNWLLPRLEGAGLRVCIDFRDFEIGTPSLVNMERAVESCRTTLLVLTPDWTRSEWTRFEAMLVQTDDPIGVRRRTLPLLLRPCEIPKRIAMLTYADFTNAEVWESQLRRLLGALRGQAGRPTGELQAEVSNLAAALQKPLPEAALGRAARGSHPSQDLQHMKGLLCIKCRRLRALELKEAKLGIYTPVHVTLEIEDLRREVAELEERLGGP